MKQVIVIGAGGHGRVAADIVRAAGDTFLGFLDDDPSKGALGAVSGYLNYPEAEFLIGVGDAAVRERLSAMDCKWYTAVHPSAVVSPSASVGEGTAVMAHAVINADAVVGKHCVINTAAVVEHDCRISDYAHISVGAKLGGAVSVGASAWIGIGAAVRNNINICGGCVVGAGAVVVKDIVRRGTYAGVPARRIHAGEMK